MSRLFVGIGIPDDVAADLLPLQYGIQGARWRPPENFHITLRFIGEADRRMMRDIDSALSQIQGYAFELKLKGVGQFGSKFPRAVWSGVEDATMVTHLASKVESAMQRIGLTPEGRKYTPHVTLAYLKGTRSDSVDQYVAAHTGFLSQSFDVNSFCLYESYLGKTASHYVKRAEYELTPALLAHEA